MTMLEPIVVKCPHCEHLMKDVELMSYTVHHSSYYSDGKSESDPILNGSKSILFCSKCKEGFWRDDAIMRDLDGYDTKYEHLDHAADMMDLPWRFSEQSHQESIHFFENLIDEKFYTNEEQEIYLRTQLWWSINDLMRGRNDFSGLKGIKDYVGFFKHRKEYFRLYLSYSGRRKKNLDRIFQLYGEEIGYDCFFHANLLRELGEFKQARFALGKHTGSKGKTYRKILQKIKKRNNKVFLVA